MTEAKGSEVVLLAGAKGSEVVLVEAKGSEVPANGSTSVSYEGGGSAGGPAVWLQGSAMPGGGGTTYTNIFGQYYFYGFVYN